ncbi:class I SAM-dependent methyltransferase [Micromonospora sp. FIMYZ51]|uniref:class I SAM-dependent methyltransferase n=1 Tax=Micromonospora sp. FIMYZ51 TaxID=3051832 RepID=UPI0031203A57
MTNTPPPGAAFAVRLWLACLATQELLTMYLGVRLGLYAELAERGPATVDELAARTGYAHRYLREWLEQQAVAGILGCDDGPDRRYSLGPGQREVLIESDSPLSLAAMAILPVGGVAGALPELLKAFRTGDGVPDAAFGEDWRTGHSGANRALFRHSLVGWIARHLPELHDRLRRAPSRVADLGCGAGWAAIALATAYPLARVQGFDVDEPTLADAAEHAARAGLADRVTFEARDCATPPETGDFDLVCVFDALHELAEPVAVLASAAAMRAPGGQVLVMDAKVADEFTAPADEVERFQYATSVLHCLPACLSGPRSAGTGTVMRADTVRAYAAQAGFHQVRTLDVPDRFHRLYLLT